MRVLVVGKGGREHAMVRALLESPSVEQVYALPGSHGMGPEVVTALDQPMETESILALCEAHKVELVVIGPEDPLVAGLADELRAKGLLVFGPDQRGAQLEGSKIFSKEFMDKYQIPTASYQKVASVSDVEKVFSQFTAPYVLKADGLAGGKGVYICKTKEELVKAATGIFEEKTLGQAGENAILEQFQPGFELSFFILSNGHDYVALPMAQDHKKLLEGGEGPNTGGMGTVAPMSISPELYATIVKSVIEPTVNGFKEENFDYRGVAFIGLMVTEQGPQVLEYNVRFGDPETQVLLPLLNGDWGQAFKTIAEGKIPKLQWKSGAAACVVLAAENYPASPVKGVSINGDLSSKKESYFLHAGTKNLSGDWQTNGGRVLNAIGLGEGLQEALDQAYQRVSGVSWPGMQYRKDIGANSQSR